VEEWSQLPKIGAVKGAQGRMYSSLCASDEMRVDLLIVPA